MPSLKVTIHVELDGTEIAAFPLVRRISPTLAYPFDIQRITAGGTVNLPTTQLAAVQAMLVQSDKALTFGIGGGTFQLNANGILCLVDSSGLGTITTLNASGSTATLNGVLAGTAAAI